MRRRNPRTQQDQPYRPLRFCAHPDTSTPSKTPLRRRIEGTPIPSPFRIKYLKPYAEPAHTWLHSEAEAIDTAHLTPTQAAQQIAEADKS